MAGSKAATQMRDYEAGPVTVGVVGVGAMGRGIAQVSATGGMQVRLFDQMDGAAEKGRALIVQQLDRLVEKGRMSAEDAAAAAGRMQVVASLAEMADADLVVEAVIEDLAVKRQVFAELEKAVRPDALLASNTSSIRIATIAADCTRKDRVAGLHFFNPVPLMKLVEVIAAPDTSPEALQALSVLGKRMGRVPVVVQDGPGFLVNLGGRAFTTEALRLASEGVADPADIDTVMRSACGFRMGPFELMDLTGIDVNYPVSQIIYGGFYHDRRLATSPLHQAMMEAGRLGRKTGQGFYDYGGDAPVPAMRTGRCVAPDTSAAPAPRIALAEPDRTLGELLVAAGAEVAADDGRMPIAAAPFGEDCTTLAARLGLDHRRLVAIDLTGAGRGCLTVMQAPGGDTACRDALVARLRGHAEHVVAINDSPGFIAQRILLMIANLGCEMAQLGIATPEDIDRAMTLGLNYPQGPLQIADAIGGRRALDGLAAIQAITGDDRYRPSLWLRRRGLLDLPMATPDSGPAAG